jgi:hypothetical protein
MTTLVALPATSQAQAAEVVRLIVEGTEGIVKWSGRVGRYGGRAAVEEWVVRGYEIARARELSAYAWRSRSAARSLVNHQVQKSVIEEVTAHLPPELDRGPLDNILKRLLNDSTRDIDTVPGSFQEELTSRLRKRAEAEAKPPSKISFSAWSCTLSVPLQTDQGKVIKAEINLCKLASTISERVVCKRPSESELAARAFFGRGRGEATSISNGRDECPS